jgi:hypothetical protein
MYGRGENGCKIVVVRSKKRPVHRLEEFKMDMKGIGFGVEE